MSVILVDRFHSGPMSQALGVGSLVGVHFTFGPLYRWYKTTDVQCPWLKAQPAQIARSHIPHTPSPPRLAQWGESVTAAG